MSQESPLPLVVTKPREVPPPRPLTVIEHIREVYADKKPLPAERPKLPEINIPEYVWNVLGGTVVPIKDEEGNPKVDKEGNDIFLLKDGSGQSGLKAIEDSYKWSSLFDHCEYTGRIGATVAQIRYDNGDDSADPQLMATGGLVSHSQRRKWDDAKDFPDETDEIAGEGSSKKRHGDGVFNEILGLQHLKEHKVPEDVYKFVESLAHETGEFSGEDSNARIFKYIDHRTTNEYQPYDKRMGQFIIGNFLKGQEVGNEKITEVERVIGNIFYANKMSQLQELGIEGITGYEAIGKEDAYNRLRETGATEKSDRLDLKDFANLIIRDAETEARYFLSEGIDPEAINDETIPVQQWSIDAHKKYLSAAEPEIKEKFGELDYQGAFDRKHPGKKWWVNGAEEIFNASSDTANL